MSPFFGFHPMSIHDDYIQIEEKDNALNINVIGEWIIENAQAIQKALDDLCPTCEGYENVHFFCGGLKDMDTSGAWLLYKRYKLFEAEGVRGKFINFPEEQFKFVKNLLDVIKEDETADNVAFLGTRRTLAGIGRISVRALCHVLDVLAFTGQLFMTFLRALAKPKRFRPRAITRHMQEAGINAVPIIVILSFLVSIVLTYQGAIQLSKFGAEHYTIGLTARSVLREMGVLMAAILIAGRSGSAYATEIGIMKINEEVDALKTLSIDPFEVLILPRVLALVIMMPLLAFISDMAGLLGGAICTNIILDIPLNQYWDYLQTPLVQTEFWIGIIKAPFFGFLIATTGCFRGMQAQSSAESVGRLTTVAVVQSIFLVMAANAIFAVVIGELGF